MLEVREMAKERSEVKKEDKWNVESLYKDLSSWEKEFQEMKKKKEGEVPFLELQRYKGKIDQDPKHLATLLHLFFTDDRRLLKLYTYAHLRHDEDMVNEKYKEAYDRISLFYNDFRSETSWIEPEILQLSDLVISRYLKEKALEPFKIYLNKIFTLKPFTLSSDKEKLLSMASKALESPEKAFGVLNHADLRFSPVIGKDGEKKELTHSTYPLYLQSEDRTVRKEAFLSLHKTYQTLENTICELIHGQVQKHIFYARARGYGSCLEAALTPHQINPSVYKSLISTVRKNLSSLHRYISFRKKLLGLETLHCYDLYLSLLPENEKKYTFKQGRKLVLDSLALLGDEYREDLRKGLEEDRWVDLYENNRKRSGAYSSGCYDSYPFILMNYQGTLRDVMTLTHEAGHSMHTLMSNRHQPYQYSRYPIFIAEVASTFHEELLFRHLLKNCQKKEERAFLINHKIDGIRTTFFRQTLFAEFELYLHELAEKGIPLNPYTLKTAYRKLNQEYYGADLFLDLELDVEFLRIPHFYYNFYVYQYATGISAASYLVEHILKEGEIARDGYLQFLSSGSSNYPLELLEKTGVNMKRGEAVENLINRFSLLVDELESMLT